MIVVHMCSASAWPAPAASTSRIVILVLQRDQVSIVNSHRPVASLQIPLPSADAHQLCFDLVLLFLFNMTPTYFRNLSPNRWPAPPSSRICWISFSRPKFSSISSPPLVPTESSFQPVLAAGVLVILPTTAVAPFLVSGPNAPPPLLPPSQCRAVWLPVFS